MAAGSRVWHSSIAKYEIGNLGSSIDHRQSSIRWPLDAGSRKLSCIPPGQRLRRLSKTGYQNQSSCLSWLRGSFYMASDIVIYISGKKRKTVCQDALADPVSPHRNVFRAGSIGPVSIEALSPHFSCFITKSSFSSCASWLQWRPIINVLIS